MAFPWRLLLILPALGLPGAAPCLTEASVRGFLGRQAAAWDRRDFDGYYAMAAPDAVFVTIHPGADGRTVREQTDPAADRAEAERLFARITGYAGSERILRIVIAEDGRSARVFGEETARFVQDGRPRHLCSRTEQRLVLRAGRILSLGQTDRAEPCP
jgi:hypothetical protein